MHEEIRKVLEEAKEKLDKLGPALQLILIYNTRLTRDKAVALYPQVTSDELMMAFGSEVTPLLQYLWDAEGNLRGFNKHGMAVVVSQKSFDFLVKEIPDLSGPLFGPKVVNLNLEKGR